MDCLLNQLVAYVDDKDKECVRRIIHKKIVNLIGKFDGCIYRSYVGYIDLEEDDLFDLELYLVRLNCAIESRLQLQRSDLFYKVRRFIVENDVFYHSCMACEYDRKKNIDCVNFILSQEEA